MRMILKHAKFLFKPFFWTNGGVHARELRRTDYYDMERAYVIVYTVVPTTGKIMYLMGLESVVHPRARAEMHEQLSKPSARTQREHLRQVIVNDETPLVASKGGRVVGHGPWQGGNFGGTLLIGRAALFGGRVRRSESAKQGLVRELVEEMRLPPILLTDEHARDALANAIDFVDGVNTPQCQHYFSLNLVDDRLRANERVRAALDLETIIVNFTMSDASNCADRVEKRALKLVDEHTFITALRSGPTADDLVAIEHGVVELATDLCALLDIEPVPRSLIDNLIAYQRSRQLPVQASIFVERFARASPLE